MINKVPDPKTYKRKKSLIAFYESNLAKHYKWLDKYKVKKGIEEYLKKFKIALKTQELINDRLTKIELTKNEIERISKLKVRPKFNGKKYWKNYVKENKNKYPKELKLKWSKDSFERKKDRILKEEGEYGWKKYQYENLGSKGKYKTYEKMLEARQKRQNENKSKRHRPLNDKYRKSWGSGVYMVECKEGIYIGYSIALRGRKCTHFQKTPTSASSIAGIFTPQAFVILEKTEDPTREEYWIKKLKPNLNKYSVA